MEGGGLFLIRLNNPVRSRHLSSKHLLNVNTEFTYRCSTTLRAHCNCDAFSQANQPPPPPTPHQCTPVMQALALQTWAGPKCPP